MAGGATRKNAIERRLDDLAGLWNEFAQDPDARLLRWLAADAEEARLLGAFAEIHEGADGGLPDLFVRFGEPFGDPAAYGRTLVASLREKYELSRAQLAADGMADDWAPPAPRPGESDARTFARACESFVQHYPAVFELMAVALLPPVAPARPAEWEGWLRGLAGCLPVHVRVMVIDPAGAPALAALAVDEPGLVRTVEPRLDMAGAMGELAREAPPAGPGGGFRRHFMALTAAAGAGDLPAARQSAAAALAIASEHGWPQMRVVIHTALGSALLGAGQVAEALVNYRAAGTVAGAAAKAGDPAGPKLQLQSRMAEAAALVADQQYAPASETYEAAAALAATQQDALMEMEGWRMAGWCHENADRPDDAWRAASRALDAAERIDAQVRPNTTLPYVGQAMLRLLGKVTCEHANDAAGDGGDGDGEHASAAAVCARMGRLVGPDWEQKLEMGGGAGREEGSGQ